MEGAEDPFKPEMLKELLLIFPVTALLDILPPAKLKARLPFPPPKNLEAANLTPPLEFKLEEEGVEGVVLSLR